MNRVKNPESAKHLKHSMYLLMTTCDLDADRYSREESFTSHLDDVGYEEFSNEEDHENDPNYLA